MMLYLKKSLEFKKFTFESREALRVTRRERREVLCGCQLDPRSPMHFMAFALPLPFSPVHVHCPQAKCRRLSITHTQRRELPSGSRATPGRSRSPPSPCPPSTGTHRDGQVGQLGPVSEGDRSDLSRAQAPSPLPAASLNDPGGSHPSAN